MSVAGIMVYATVFENPLWIIGTLLLGPVGLAFGAFMFTEEKVLSLVRDLGAKAVSTETQVSAKWTESESTQYGNTITHHMRFESPPSVSFDVSWWEFRKFDKGDRVLVRYFPHSRTIGSIRKA